MSDRTGATTRPAYEDDLKGFIAEHLNQVRKAAIRKDFAEFEAAFHSMVAEANAYHDKTNRPYIVWKLPDYPPPDLDLTPR